MFYIFLIEYAGGVKIQKIKHNEQLVEVPGRLWELRVREPHCEHGHGWSTQWHILEHLRAQHWAQRNQEIVRERQQFEQVGRSRLGYEVKESKAGETLWDYPLYIAAQPLIK